MNINITDGNNYPPIRLLEVYTRPIFSEDGVVGRVDGDGRGGVGGRR